jgi:hypothetical protein
MRRSKLQLAAFALTFVLLFAGFVRFAPNSPLEVFGPEWSKFAAVDPIWSKACRC